MANEQQHTPEPWNAIKDALGNFMIVDTDGDKVFHGGYDGELVFDNPANARRIVACVNVCAGVSTAFIEGALLQAGGLSALRAAYDGEIARATALKKQRNDLLATIIGCKSLIELDGDPHGIARTMQAAIERCVGAEPEPPPAVSAAIAVG